MTQSSAGGNTGTSTFPNTYVGWEALPLRSSAPTTHQVASSIDLYHIGTTGNELTGLSRFAALPTNLSGVTVSLVKYYAKCFDPAPTAGSSLPLNVTLSLYECLRPWDAALATWNTYDGTNAWGAGGGLLTGTDIGGRRAAVTTVLGAAAAQSFGTGPQSGSFVVFTGGLLATLVQDWMNGVRNNNGFLLRLAVDESGNGPRLRTPSGVSDSARDYMEITYSVMAAYSANELETGAPADTQDAFITYFLTVSEAGALIEASTSATDAPVVRSEVLAGTDASAVALASLQALSEALTAIDADSASVASLQALAEALTAADADSASVVSLQAVAEVLSAADTNASSVGSLQALAEALNAVDAVNSSVATLQALAEAVSATDANTVSVATLQAVAETMSAADANSSSAVILQALVEVLTAIDANSVSIAGLQALAEALNAIDARSASMSTNALVIAEALNAIETDSASVANLQALAEALNAVDTNSISVANAPSIAEVLTAADANLSSVASLQALAEALNAADADDSSVATLQALAEALNAIDASFGTPTNALTVAEVSNAADISSLSFASLPSLAETLAAIDASTTATVLAVVVAEAVSTLADVSSTSVITPVVVAEAVSTLAEVNSSSFIATAVVVDSPAATGIAAVDTSNYSTTPTAGIGEGAALQDNSTGSITSGVGVVEAASAIETDSANADNAARLIEAGNAVDTTNIVAAIGLTSTQVEPSTLAALQDASLTLSIAICAEVLAAIESLFAQDLHERVVEEAMVLVDQQSVPAVVPGIAAVIDSLNAQDIATIVQLAAAQAVADALAASESFALAYEYNSSIVEALAAIETASSMLTVQVFAIGAEALNAVDASVNSSPGNPEDVRESVFVQERYTAQGNANVIASNPLSVTDLAAAMVAFTGSVLNGMSAVETVLGMLRPAVTTADALNAVDATNYGIVLVAIANELLNAAETVTNTGSNVTKTLSDALAAADTTTPLTGSTPSVRDTLSLIDAFTRTGAAQFAGVIEVGNATMLAFTTADLPVAVADVLSAIEATNAAVGVFYNASGSEVLTALDTVDAANEWARGCFDRLSASDQQSITDISGYKPGAPVWTVEYRRRVWYRDLQVKRS